MKKYKNAKEWVFFDKGMNDSDVTKIANQLRTNKLCKSLDLERNRITSSGAYDLADMLKVNNTLKKLRLGYNQLGDHGASTICDVLKRHNNTLTYLQLRNNGITDSSVDTIIQMIEKNQSLESLALENNLLSKENRVKIETAAWLRKPPLSIMTYGF